MASGVFRAILEGTRYPEALYQGVLLRIRAEQNVTRGRAAIIKAYLCATNYIDKGVLSVSLNPQSENKAYVLGRLFAILEQAQEAASPGLNSTIKDRFFVSACATPGVVFPRLLKLANYHTSKAQYGYVYEKQIGELVDKISMGNEMPFPTHLSQ